MKGLFIPEITAEMFRNGCLESIEALMAEGEIYDIDYQKPCDAISRQAAIDILRDKWHKLPDANDAMQESIDDIKLLPPVTPQPKIGHWIEDAKTYYEELNKRGLGVDEYTPYFVDDIACSECLAKYSVMDNETQFFKHCPNCGARMEVET